MIEKFKENSWSYDEDKNGKGISQDSLYAIKLLSLSKNDKAMTKVKASIEKLLGQAYRTPNSFFILTKNITQKDFNLQVNVVLADIFSNTSDLIKALSLEEDILLLRNYFLEKARSAITIHTLSLALTGL